MDNVVDLEECFLDSPPYRQRLARCDTYLQEIEHCLRNVVKAARTVINGNNELSEQYVAFAESLIELGRLEANRPTREPFQPFDGDMSSWSAGQHIMFLAEELKRIEVARKSLSLQLETILVDPLETLSRTDLPAIREQKKRWDRTGTEYLHENSRYMSRKTKDAGLIEGATELANLRKIYHETSLDYVGRIGEVLVKEKLRITEAIMGLCQSRFAFCEKEHTVLDDIVPNLKFLEQAATIDQNRQNTLVADHEIQREEILFNTETLYNPLNIDSPRDKVKQPSSTSVAIEKSGYLYKKSSHAVRPVWSRRFFSLHDNCLEYYTMEGKNNSATVLIDLRLCTGKKLDLSDRRNCFEIVSPVKTYTLQAENEREVDEWLVAIQSSIREAIQSGQVNLSAPDLRTTLDSPCQELLSSYLPGAAIEAALSEELREEIRLVPGNFQCADCGASDPEWASLSLGILVCIECSGIHRSLGVHKSKVRSLRLDFWEPEHVELMKGIGNQAAQAIFEASYCESKVAFYRKPTVSSTHEEKEHWIIAKYDLGKFITPWKGTDEVIRNAIKESNLPICLHWLASGNNPDSIIDPLTLGAPLHVAINSCQWTAAAFFILWAADLEAPDLQGQSPLHLLARSDNFSLSLLVSILRRHVDTTQTDLNGQDPMAVAMAHSHGDFVTVLRMFQHDMRKKPCETPTVKRQSFRRMLKQNAKFYRKWTHPPRRRRSSLGSVGSEQLGREFERMDLSQGSERPVIRGRSRSYHASKSGRFGHEHGEHEDGSPDRSSSSRPSSRGPVHSE